MTHCACPYLVLVYLLVLLGVTTTAHAQQGPLETPSTFLDEKQAVWRNGMPESKGRILPILWEVEFTTLTGSPLRLADYRGAYVLLNFWGEWCKPCLEELPMLVAASKKIPAAHFQIIGMLRSYDEDSARKMLDQAGATWPQVLIDEQAAGQFGVLGYPMNVLILPDGNTYEKRYLIDDRFIEQYVASGRPILWK